MGVWIETLAISYYFKSSTVTPCMGVWIETDDNRDSRTWLRSHPVWVCGLKQEVRYLDVGQVLSHPVWVCGLKPSLSRSSAGTIARHTLYGCVD